MLVLWGDLLDDMLDVITVVSSLLSGVVGVEHRVGYDILLAELT